MLDSDTVGLCLYYLQVLCSEGSLLAQHPLVEGLTQWYIQLGGVGYHSRPLATITYHSRVHDGFGDEFSEKLEL